MNLSRDLPARPMDLWKAAPHLPTSSTGSTTKCVTYVLISFRYRSPDIVHICRPSSTLASSVVGAGFIPARAPEARQIISLGRETGKAVARLITRGAVMSAEGERFAITVTLGEEEG